MDACLINAGEIITIAQDHIIVETKPLQRINGVLIFGKTMHRKLHFQTEKDLIIPSLSVNDWVTYHWGYVCQKVSLAQRRNLSFYTNRALQFAQYEQNNFNYR
jgi:hypothetical protein